MGSLAFARVLYRQGRFDSCLSELYKNTFEAKVMVWGSVLSSIVLSCVSLSMLATGDFAVALAFVALIGAFVGAAFAIALDAAFGALIGVALALALAVVALAFVALVFGAFAALAFGALAFGAALAGAAFGDYLIKYLCKKILKEKK